MRRSKSVVNYIFITALCVLLSIYALSIIATLLWGFINSFKNPYEYMFNDNWLGLPTLDPNNLANSRKHLFELYNYGQIFEFYHLVEENCKTSFIVNGKVVTHVAKGGFPMVLVNTAIYTAVGSLLHTFIPAITAFMVAKYKNPVSKLVLGAALFALTTPIVGAQASMLTMLRNMGIYDSFWGYLIQKAGFGGMYFFVCVGFYESMPDSFAEAAEIDGASQLDILIKIVLPLSVKMLSMIFLIQFIHFWNDYQTAYLYMPSHPTLAYVVWFLTTNNQVGGGDMVVRVAASMMLALPILIIFIIMKDKLMGNVTSGGLKG